MRQEQQPQPMGMMQKLQGLLGIAEQAAQLEDRPRLMDLREQQAMQQSQLADLNIQKLQEEMALEPERRAMLSQEADSRVLDRVMAAMPTLEGDPALRAQLMPRLMEMLRLKGGGQPAVNQDEMLREIIRKHGLGSAYENLIRQQQTR